MAQRRDLATEEFIDMAEGRSPALARVLSIVFSPPLTAIASCVFLAYMQPQPVIIGLGWALLLLVVQMAPGVVLYTYRRRTGAYRDADVSRRQDRNELYLLGSFSVLASIVLLIVFGAPAAFLALAIATLALGVICGLVNLFWKISMHAATVGAFATIAALYTPVFGGVLWVCALAVGWARVRTRNHTPMQVAAGLAASALVTSAVFTLTLGR